MSVDLPVEHGNQPNVAAQQAGPGKARGQARDPGARTRLIRRILVLAREYLSMELGYFGTFDEGVETYRVVEGTSDRLALREGATLALQQTLCWHVTSGQIGNAVRDTRQDTVTRDLVPVREGGVGAYLGVPVRADGRLLGMLCLIDPDPHPGMAGRDVEVLRLLADVLAFELAQDEAGDRPDDSQLLIALQNSINPGSSDLSVVFRPVARLATRLGTGALDVHSVEARSRFWHPPARPAEYWFDLARRNGLGVDAEMAAIERALRALPDFPGRTRVAIRVSPETLASVRLRDALAGTEADRVILELTEHALVDDYEGLRPALDRARATGAKVAIDDFGTGYSNLQHVVELAPDLIKLDASIIEHVESNPIPRAIVAALVSFTRDTGITLVTDGIERAGTAQALVDLGVEYGQGDWVGTALRPDALAHIMAT